MEDLSKVPVEELEFIRNREVNRVLAVLASGRQAARPYIIIFDRPTGGVDYYKDLTLEGLHKLIRRKPKRIKLKRELWVYKVSQFKDGYAVYVSSLDTCSPDTRVVARIPIEVDVEEGHGICSGPSSSD